MIDHPHWLEKRREKKNKKKNEEKKREKERKEEEKSLTKVGFSNRPFAIEPPVSPAAPTSKTFVRDIMTTEGR